MARSLLPRVAGLARGLVRVLGRALQFLLFGLVPEVVLKRGRSLRTLCGWLGRRWGPSAPFLGHGRRSKMAA